MTALRHKRVHKCITQSKASRKIWPQVREILYDWYTKLLCHTQSAHGKDNMQCI